MMNYDEILREYLLHYDADEEQCIYYLMSAYNLDHEHAVEVVSEYFRENC